ncbi:MAG: nucleotidyl transferase AbiEii/AbiGii toxin family protein [Calditrichaeota bacterium]|nr:nucleotidyl transferase AbiEii/AbiGii toxin family protein [Calditrichota bacterium]
MIHPKCFTEEWILLKRDQIGRVDPTLLEKCIYAFELLAQLVTKGLIFIFKGGTSLILLLSEFRRLSIDVDIVCNEKREKIESIFNAVVSDSPFSRWQEDVRMPTRIPKSHFRFYFHSNVNNREDYVLLDILKESMNFPHVQSVHVNLPFFILMEEVWVTVPTIEGLVGDKLTALAPWTIGIPLQEDRSMQLIKQVFDLGELFVHISDFHEIFDSYNVIHSLENKYRNTSFTTSETLQDTIDICFLISQMGLRGGVEDESTRILMRRIRSHLMGVNYHLDDARISASRAALIAKILQKESFPPPFSIVYNSEVLDQIRNVSLTGNLFVLNRLKSIAPEAFYYWYLIFRLEG